MIRAARRASLLLAFYLLTSAATADAACAWVLWTELGLKFPGNSTEYDWGIYRSYPSPKECESALTERTEQFLKSGYSDRGNGVLFSKGRSGLESTARFICLPDTVDPRGPKGGAR